MANYFEDKRTHLYTLVIKPDNTYRVSIDHKEIMSGSLLTVSNKAKSWVNQQNNLGFGAIYNSAQANCRREGQKAR